MSDVTPPESLVGQRVLVTGGAGFIGSHLVEALADDTDLRVLDDFSTGQRERLPDAVSTVRADVCDEAAVGDAVREADVVVHLAGVVSVAESTDRPVESQSVNVGGTMRVLDAARRADARVVVASSAAVYGHPETVPIPESARLDPVSPYGVDKLAADQYTRLFADLYGLPTVTLRFFNVYGPGQPADGYSGVVSTFLDSASTGAPLTVHGDGSQTRDFVHVDDVVRAILRAAVTDHTGRAFNVGTGEATSIRDLAETVRQVAPADPDVVHVDGRDGDVDHSVADLTAARQRLAFEPTVGLLEGLRALVHTAGRAD